VALIIAFPSEEDKWEHEQFCDGKNDTPLDKWRFGRREKGQ
jgi:hypothetical protein